MTAVEQLVPEKAEVMLDRLLAKVTSARTLPCFSEELIDFLDQLSQRLFSDTEAQEFPELQALAFYIRRSSVMQLITDKQNSEGTAIVPAGIAFHLVPANIDAMFIYSWLFSALAGNINVIRVSKSRRSEQTTLICKHLNKIASESSSDVQNTICVLSYDHDDEITQQISEIADLRVIWGGDETVAKIKKIPGAARTRDIVFPDRYSLSLVNATEYLETSLNKKNELAYQFFNDSYWYDQAACSSPRQVIFFGSQSNTSEARFEFFEHLNKELVRRSFQFDAGSALAKMTDLYDCVIDLPVQEAFVPSNELAVLKLKNQMSLPEKHASRGTFYVCEFEALSEVIPLLSRRVQTASYFGFDHAQLKVLVKAANGRGIDRLVPIGQSLNFDRHWDGLDLLNEFTRVVSIR